MKNTLIQKKIYLCVYVFPSNYSDVIKSDLDIRFLVHVFLSCDTKILCRHKKELEITSTHKKYSVKYKVANFEIKFKYT